MYTVKYKNYSAGYHNIYTQTIQGSDWEDAIWQFYAWALQAEGWQADKLPDGVSAIERIADKEYGIKVLSIERNIYATN